MGYPALCPGVPETKKKKKNQQCFSVMLLNEPMTLSLCRSFCCLQELLIPLSVGQTLSVSSSRERGTRTNLMDFGLCTTFTKSSFDFRDVAEGALTEEGRKCFI